MPLRVVPSSKGLSSKRCPGIGILSRVNREIGVFRHVSPSTRLCLEYPRETGLILRCTGKGGNPFKTKQGNQPSCHDPEGRRGPDVVLEKTLTRVPLTARRSNLKEILKEINPEYSLERLMLKLKLQYFGHLMQRANSLEKTLMLGKIEGRS